MKLQLTWLVGSAGLLFGVVTTPCFAQAATANASAAAATVVSDERIGQLVGQLGDETFAKRESATAQLKAIGKPAVPQLEAAAKNHDPEVRVRATEILEAINGPTRPATPNRNFPGGMQIVQAGGFGGGVMVQGQVVGGGGGAFVVRGQPMVLNLQAAGQTAFADDGKKYRVTRTTNNDVTKIKVEITETKDGKEVHREVEADSDDDLAKKDAALAKLVKEHTGEARPNAVMQFNLAGGIGQGAGAVIAQAPMAVNIVINDGGQTLVGGGEPNGDLREGFGVKLEAADKGVRVVEIKDKSPAAKLGLQKGDVITKANAMNLDSVAAATIFFSALKATDPVNVDLLRDAKPLSLKMK